MRSSSWLAAPSRFRPRAGWNRTGPSTAPTPNGDELDLKDFRGQVVLVNFWGTYCPPCVAEMPDLQALQNSLADEPFTILSVNVEESPETVTAWAASHDLTFPIVISDDGTINPTLALHRMPTTWFIDADGISRGKMEGRSAQPPPADRPKLLAEKD